MELGERLSLLRKQRGMTQMELAEALDISRQAVSRWEQGMSEPSTANLIRIGQLFGIPVDALVNGDAQSPAEADAQTAETNPEEAKSEEAKPEEAEPEEANPEETAPEVAKDPLQVIPPKPRRWLVAVCAGVVCALLLGIAALIGVHSINRRLEPGNVVPAEEIEGKKVDESVIIVQGTLHP